MPAIARPAPGWRGLALLLVFPALAGAAHAAPAGDSGSPSGYAPAPGGLLVAPTRVVFEGRQRSAELTLVNTSDRTATYRISLVHMRMGEHGEMQQATAPDSLELLTDSMIRYSPRRTVLPPGVPQTVRIQLRLPSVLEPGEYRTHLLFRQVPDVDTTAGAHEEA